MTGKRRSYIPAMSDASVKARTGKNWVGWFTVLDQEDATTLGHKAIAAMLSKKYGVSSWWSQMVTVEYERSRGLRVRHEKASGFSVAVSKTVAVSLSDLYAATANAAMRRKWFPKGAFELSSQTKDKYFRGSWNKRTRLEIGFYAKGEEKAQIALQVSKLPKEGDVERERAAWKAALLNLKDLLED